MRIPGKNALEWSVFAVGVLCIGAVVGYLVSEALRSSQSAAEVVVRLGAVEARGGRAHIPVTLRNSGGTAARGIEVEVLLDREGRVVDRARLTVDLLPRSATREGWVSFDSTAATGDQVRVGGVAFGGR